MQPAAGSRQQAGDSRQGQSASTSAHKWPLGIVTLQAPAKIGYAFGSTAADAVWEVGTPLDVHGGTSGRVARSACDSTNILAPVVTQVQAPMVDAGAPGRRNGPSCGQTSV